MRLSSFFGRGPISLLHNDSPSQLSYQKFVFLPLVIIFLMHALKREMFIVIPLHILDREDFFSLEDLDHILQGGF